MHIACGIWGRSVQQFGGTGEFCVLTTGHALTISSFLVKDAQEDLSSERLKA